MSAKNGAVELLAACQKYDMASVQSRSIPKSKAGDRCTDGAYRAFGHCVILPVTASVAETVLSQLFNHSLTVLRSQTSGARYDEYGQLVNQADTSPQWLQDMFSQHIKKLQENFTVPLLKPSGIRGEYISTLNTNVSSQNCQSCSMQHSLKGETFCVELESKLTQALDEVRFILGNLSHSDDRSRNP
ncbi:hypothetical protein EDB85DRAFT_2283183 [Lactarius pseudohatsudake]|nr:hypothetical protein EDB85DRAFT_2283183 [Lactarius pseudohatsudake]